METSLLEKQSSLLKSLRITFVSIRSSALFQLCESLRFVDLIQLVRLLWRENRFWLIWLIGLVDRRFQRAPDLVEIVENEV